MKAFVYHNYGSADVLKFDEVEKPAPKDDEVLIKVVAASINAYDWRLMTANPAMVRLMGVGFFQPKNKILGADVAGVVEAVGKDVKSFKPGDEVFGDLSYCGNGAFAEYACAEEKYLASKPPKMQFADAAALPMAANTALQGLRDTAQIKAGQNVLIYGASGGVGTFAVQVAKHFQAEVTAVCSTPKVEMVKGLGADIVIDYKTTDFAKHNGRYDIVMGVNGHVPLAVYKRMLNPRGIYLMAGGNSKQLFEAILLGQLTFAYSGKRMALVSSKPNSGDLTKLAEMCEAGSLKPVIDRKYPLEQLPDAIRYVEAGHAAGKVVVEVGG